jgi:hypothetical protein
VSVKKRPVWRNIVLAGGEGQEKKEGMIKEQVLQLIKLQDFENWSQRRESNP